MAERLHLAPRHRALLTGLLRQHLPAVEVWAYGSRVNGRSHDGSDLDLVLRGPELGRIPFECLEGFWEAVRESTIPFLVEARDWAHLPERFQREIEREYVVLVGAEPEDHAARAWPKCTLGDVIDLRLSSVDKKIKSTERHVRLCNYMDVYKNQFIHSGLNFMNGTATAREISNCALYSGDVVITKDSEKHDDIGVPALVREDIPELVCGYHLAILRPASPNIDGGYLFYALNTHEAQKQFHSYANGITRFGLRKSDIGLVEIPLPPLAEQRAIGRVLGALDDKIEANRGMNATLEAMAQALFQDWFVAFGPTRAKLAGRAPYLPEPLWSLFPDRMTDSELGEIPEGWKIKAVGECCNLTMGQSPPGHSYNDQGDGLPFFQGRTDFQFRFPKRRKFCTSPKKLAQPGDTLVSVRAPVGDINMALETSCIGRGIAAVRHKSHSRSFTYYLIRSIQKSIANYEHTGTVFGAITGKQFQALSMLEPCYKVVEAFDTYVSPMDASIECNTTSSHTLTALRDTLLPKLISGNIRLHDTARPKEAVA